MNLDSVTEQELDRSLGVAEALLYVGDSHKAIELTNQFLSSRAGAAGPARARCLLIRAAALRLRGFLEQSLEDASSALALLDPRASEPRLIVQAHKQIGIPLAMRGDLAEAIEHLTTALRFCSRAADLSLEADIHDSLGVCCARSGRFAEAQAHYQNAATAYEKCGRHAELATLLNNVGRLHYDLGEYGPAIASYEKSIAIARQFRYFRTESMALVNTGDARRETGDLKGALSAYERAVQIATEAQEPRVNCCANIGIGVTNRLLGQPARARFYLAQARYEAERLQLGWELAEAELESGILARATGQDHDAEALLRRSIAGFERLGANHGAVRASLFLAEILRRARRRRELASVMRRVDAIGGAVTIDQRLLHVADANREAIRETRFSRRADGLLAQLQRGLIYRHRRSFVVSHADRVSEHRRPRIRVYTLGHFRVTVDGKAIPGQSWESRTARELFVLLLCHKNGKTCEELLELLWPEDGLSRRRGAVHNSAYRARKTLPGDCIVREDGRYRIGPVNSVWFDLDEFRGLSHSASLETSDPSRRAATLSEANRLYRGDFLPASYSDWALDLRRQAEVLYVGNLSALASIQMDSGRLLEARSNVERILRIDPANEFASRQSVAIRASGA